MPVTVHQVAVVVFADVPGTDPRDAGHRLVAAVGEQLGDTLPCPSRGRDPLPSIAVLDVVDLNAAATTGYLTIRPVDRRRP